MSEQGSIDSSYLNLPPSQRGSIQNLAGAINSILGLGTGLRDLYGKALIAESLQLKRTSRPPANPQLGMILRPDGKGFDPLNDGGLKMVTWDVATETWVELGSGGGGGSGIPFEGFSRFFHVTSSSEVSLTNGAYTKLTWTTDENSATDSVFSLTDDELIIGPDDEGVWLLAAAGFVYGHGNRHGIVFYDETAGPAPLKYGGFFSEKSDLAGSAFGAMLVYLEDGQEISCRMYSDSNVNTANLSGAGVWFAGIRLTSTT